MSSQARRTHRTLPSSLTGSPFWSSQACLLSWPNRWNIWHLWVRLILSFSLCIPLLRSSPPPHFIRAYSARMSFYRLKQFQCEVTGKSGLDYFQAVESERHEARTLHSRFSEPLKPAVLKAVQWRRSCSSSLCHPSFTPYCFRGHGPPWSPCRSSLRPLQGSLFRGREYVSLISHRTMSLPNL